MPRRRFRHTPRFESPEDHSFNEYLLNQPTQSTTRTELIRLIRGGEDTYVIFDQQQGKDVYFKVLIKPLVNLIWIAGFVFLAGSLVALWPDAREQRRLVARLALARG